MPEDAYVIGIAGGTCSGKSTVAKALADSLDGSNATVLSLDWYYRIQEGNFDHPDAIDFAAVRDDLVTLLKGQSALIPTFERHVDLVPTGLRTAMPNRFIILEGMYALYDEQIRALLNLKVFLDIDAEIRLARRIVRDVTEYGEDLPATADYYLEFVRPMYQEFVEHQREFADVVISRGTLASQVHEILQSM